MHKLGSLMREARLAEQSGELRRAIQLYRKVLSLQEKEEGGGELGLYNALGDLYLRVGDVESGVACFERAAERQEEEQLYANAIALCKKILRNAPGRTHSYRRVGRLQAVAGLQAEARESYIEYANRMEREGSPDLAREALEEFAELSGDEEIRLALADRYLVADRAEAALGQLRCVWGSGSDGGRMLPRFAVAFSRSTPRRT